MGLNCTAALTDIWKKRTIGRQRVPYECGPEHFQPVTTKNATYSCPETLLKVSKNRKKKKY